MQDCLPLLHRRLQTTQAHACEHALASGLVSTIAETHTDSLKRRSSCQDHEELQIIALPLSCHHTKMKRSQRPRAFTVRVVPNKSCHRHRRQLSPCACHRCSCHTKNKKNYFPSSSCSPASSQEARPCYSVWRRFCGEKPAIQGGHIKAHCASINDTGLDLCSALLTITLYIDNPTYIYI